MFIRSLLQNSVFLSTVLFVSSCGSSNVADQVPVEVVNGQSGVDSEGAPHLYEDFYDQHWPRDPWTLLEESIEDYIPYDPDKEYAPNRPKEAIDEALLKSLPRSIGSLGDSMSQAALASYKRSNLVLPWVWAQLATGALISLVKGGGDTSGFESPGLSWTTGQGEWVYKKSPGRSNRVKKILVKKVLSHALRVEEMMGESIKAIIGAKSGDTSEELRNYQIDKLMSQSRKTLGQSTPDYVTMLIGANDICAKSVYDMTQSNVFYDRVSYAVEKILSSNRKARVLLVSLPDIESLRKVAKDAQVSITQPAGALLGCKGLTCKCENIWKKIPMCPTIMLETDEDKRRLIQERVADYNLILKELSDVMGEAYGQRVRFSDTSGIEFTPDDISFDCFHPNVLGQNKLAEYSWQGSFWSTQSIVH